MSAISPVASDSRIDGTLSPIALTQKLDEAGLRRLYDAIRAVIPEWIERLRGEAGEGFPEDVTAFRPQMAVHGRFGKPCPVCGAPVQRVIVASNFAMGKAHLLKEGHAAKHGFTQYRRAGNGVYEKTMGKGPKYISGD